MPMSADKPVFDSKDEHKYQSVCPVFRQVFARLAHQAPGWRLCGSPILAIIVG
jgi:hypothetical protein